MELRILATLEDGVARLTLNDPARLNALSLDMIDAAIAVLDEMMPRARVLLISGRGRGFCSGGVVDTEGANDPAGVDGGAALASHFNPLVRRIRDAPIPVVTRVQGAAAGFGASLALAADMIVASHSAFFVQVFRHLGLVPDGGASAILVHSIGRIRAVELMLTGERLSARKAYEWGLITRVVPDEELDDTVEALVAQLAAGPTVALGRIRRMAWAATENGFEQGLAAEIDGQRACVRTADHKEGVAAFTERRPPVFQGR